MSRLPPARNGDYPHPPSRRRPGGTVPSYAALGDLPELAAEVRSSGALARIAELVDAARASGVRIVRAVAERRPDGRGASRNARLFRAAERLPVRRLTGSAAVRVAAPVRVADEDLVVRRLRGLSPIQGTDVDPLLRDLGCRTLIVTGVSADVAVPDAVFDAVNRGCTVVLPTDAVAGVPAGYTRAMIRHTPSPVATLATTDEVHTAFARGGPPPHPGRSGQGDRVPVDGDRHGRQRLGRRAALHTAVGDGEVAVVAGAVDDPVRDALHGAPPVGAGRRERLELTGRRLGDHDLAVGEDLAAALGDLRGRGERAAGAPALAAVPRAAVRRTTGGGTGVGGRRGVVGAPARGERRGEARRGDRRHHGPAPRSRRGVLVLGRGRGSGGGLERCAGHAVCPFRGG